MRLALYARVSDKKQADNYSTESQLADMQRYATTHNHWDMNDPHVAGGMAELYNWNDHPNYHLWSHRDEKAFEVRWWKPAYHTSIVTTRRFATIEKTYSFYMKLRNRGYVEKV